jgi:hypothetical protein
MANHSTTWMERRSGLGLGVRPDKQEPRKDLMGRFCTITCVSGEMDEVGAESME